MRLQLLALLVLTAPAVAQSPLSMPFTGNNGLSTSGAIVFFDLNVLNPSGITITTLDVNTGTSTVGTLGTIEVYTGPTTFVGNEQNAAPWSLTITGAVIAQGSNQPSPTCLGSGLFLPPGPHGIALRHVGVGVRYTDGTGTNQTGATADVTLSAGAAVSAFFSGSYFNPRVFNGNIRYNVGSVPGIACATSSTYGTGCYAGTTTFYELFATLGAFDFAGGPGTEQVLRAIAGGAIGYAVSSSPAAWFTPTGTQVLNNAATPAAIGDNQFSDTLTLPFSFPFPGGSTTVVHAAANGYVQLGATTSNASDLSPTVNELLTLVPRLCPLWCDLHPLTNVSVNPASGIYFDVDPNGQVAYITWRDVADRRGGVPVAGATSVNVQVALFASGDYEFRYGTIVPSANAGNVITGWSKGNTGGTNSLDPGSVDLSASLPLVTTGPDRRPLVQRVGLPRLGTSFTLSASDVPNLVPLGLVFFGDTIVNPGIDLGIIGAPGCNGYTNANLGSATFPVTLPAGTGSFTLAIPNNPALTGATFTSQLAAFTTLNALTLATSNGASWTLGG